MALRDIMPDISIAQVLFLQILYQDSDSVGADYSSSHCSLVNCRPEDLRNAVISQFKSIGRRQSQLVVSVLCRVSNEFQIFQNAIDVNVTFSRGGLMQPEM